MAQVKKEELRKRILKEAKGIFLKKGFRGAKMREISGKVRCSLSNLYNYYPSKDHILLALMEDRVKEVRNALQFAGSIRPPEGKIIVSYKEDKKRITEVVKYLHRNREDLCLLFVKSEGSVLESFKEEVVESYAEVWFNHLKYLEKKYPRKKRQKISRFFIYNISRFYIDTLIDFLKRGLGYEDMMKYAMEMTTYSYYGCLALMK